MKLIAWYFKKKLETWGYGECDVSYSLGHCQGDGVAWYGGFDEESIRRLASRLFSPSRERIAAVRRVLDKGALNMSVRKCGPHMYDHFNTMEVSCEVDEDEITPFELNAVDELIKAIEEDVVDCSKVLERDGYGITGAYWHEDELLRQYEHGDAIVEVWKRSSEHDGMDDLMEPSNRYLFARSIIRGEVEIYDLELKIYVGGKPFESEWICDVSDAPGGSYWRSLARELLREARDHHRRALAVSAAAVHETKQAA